MSKITVTREDLHKVLASALPMASTDDTVPKLCVIRLVYSGGEAQAQATDRFTMAVATCKAEGDDGFAALIGRDDVKRLVSLLKPSKSYLAQERITVSIEASDTYTLALTIATFDGTTTVPTVNDNRSDFPRLGKFLEGEWGEAAPGVFSLGLDKLAQFTTAAKFESKKGPAIVLRSKSKLQGKPYLVEIGNWFTGAIMPVRVDDVEPRTARVTVI